MQEDAFALEALRAFLKSGCSWTTAIPAVHRDHAKAAPATTTQHSQCMLSCQKHSVSVTVVAHSGISSVN